MHMIFEVTVGFSLAAMLATIVGLVIAWCWRVAARRVSRGGVAVFLVAIGIATVEAQKNMTNNPPSGVSAPLTETAPSALVCGTPNAVGSETGLCFSGIGTTNGVVRLGFVWPEDGRCSDAIDVFGNWSLTNKQWVFVDSCYLRWPVSYQTISFDWAEVFSNAVSSGIFPTNATLSAGFFTAEWELDSDEDWLWDGEERLVYHTNPYSTDTDGDGLLDGEEVFDYGTDPANPDTDGDGFSDGWDTTYYDALDPDEPTNPDADDDGDGLSNRLEYELGSAPDSMYSDADSLPDAWEVAHGLDPASADGQDGDSGDPDFDGYQNIEEYWYGTDPMNPDTDGDGKTDGLDERPTQADSGSFAGQSEWWVRTMFPNNCDQILRVGYSSWVDTMVGRKQRNGYCKFVASFPEAPATSTLLHVGPYRMMVDAAGDYPFLLEKGLEYAFGTSPFVSNVVYAAADDIASLLTSFVGLGEANGVWTVDNRGLWLVHPRIGFLGLFHWMPLFKGSPDCPHVYSLGGCSFTAELSDSGPSVLTSYRWSCADDNVVIENPHARTTRVSFSALPAWRQVELLAQAVIGTNVLESTLKFSYGEHQTPVATLALSVPKVIAVGKTTRCSVTIRTADDEGGHVYLRNYASLGVDVWSDAELTQPLGSVSEFEVGSEPETTIDFYVRATSPSSAVDAEMFSADYVMSSETLTQTCRYTAIAPVVEPITTERIDGRIVNPCCGIVGSNAWFKVDVLPATFPDASIHWHVDEGSASFLRGSTGRQVLVAPQGDYPIALAVDFGGYSDERTKFNLRPTPLYEVPVYACEISSPKQQRKISDAVIAALLRDVNVVYEQVGVRLNLSGTVDNVVNREWNMYALANKQVQMQMRQVLTSLNKLTICFVDGRDDSPKPISGSYASNVIIVRKNASAMTLAHEIGHACGLVDIYCEKDGVGLSQAEEEITLNHLQDDFGWYEFPKGQSEIINAVLMLGIGSSEKCDIPSGSVYGVDAHKTKGNLAVGGNHMGFSSFVSD